MSSDPLIIALDLETRAEAVSLVSRLGNDASFYKVGLELFANAGMDIVHDLTALGKRVFLDLKFYDIGETVKRATAQVAQSGATFLTIYGSPSVMRAAVQGRAGADLKLLAVTVLTSLDDHDLQEEGYHRSVHNLVAFRVAGALESKVDGLIGSPLEAQSIRKLAGPQMLLITPGVRSLGAAIGDQKRVATPAEALQNGADYVVIGRQVTRASDPLVALRAIRAELDQETPHPKFSLAHHSI